jgi:molybdopterin/thiamine biosynthesis adenylyltransferase
MLEGPLKVTLVDGDKLEKKNLNRQLFTERHIGLNKAEALAQVYGCQFIDEWYSPTLIEHNKLDWIIGAVDNHPARKSVLQSCDISGCRAIFGANEVHSSEAFVYLPEWCDTKLDPRNYYPEIQSDRSNDPSAQGIGCTGEAQEANRQLVTANFMAAALVGHLYVVWAQEARKMEAEALQYFPYKLVNNLTKNETHKVKDAK